MAARSPGSWDALQFFGRDAVESERRKLEGTFGKLDFKSRTKMQVKRRNKVKYLHNLDSNIIICSNDMQVNLHISPAINGEH